MQNLWHKVGAQQMILAKQPMCDPWSCRRQPWVPRVTLRMLADPTPGVQAHPQPSGAPGVFSCSSCDPCTRVSRPVQTAPPNNVAFLLSPPWVPGNAAGLKRELALGPSAPFMWHAGAMQGAHTKKTVIKEGISFLKETQTLGTKGGLELSSLTAFFFKC